MWPVEVLLFLKIRGRVCELQVAMHLSKFIMREATHGASFNKTAFLQTHLVQWNCGEGRFISSSTNFQLTVALEYHQMKCTKYLYGSGKIHWKELLVLLSCVTYQ